MPESGGWVESVEQLEKYMEIHPESDRYADLAEQLVLAGRPEEALRWCEQGLHSHPHHVPGYVVLGKALFALSRGEDGFQAFEQALGLARDPLLHVELTRFFLHTGRVEAARQMLSLGFASYPEHPELMSLQRELEHPGSPGPARVTTQPMELVEHMNVLQEESLPDHDGPAFGDLPPTRPEARQEPDLDDSLAPEISDEVRRAMQGKPDTPPAVYDEEDSPIAAPWKLPDGVKIDDLFDHPPVRATTTPRLVESKGRASKRADDSSAVLDRERVPNEPTSHVNMMLVLLPFLVVGVLLGIYFAIRHGRTEKIATLYVQARTSVALDTMSGLLKARIQLQELLDLDTDDHRARALLAVVLARLSTEHDALPEGVREAEKILATLPADRETALELLWARIHLAKGHPLSDVLGALAKEANHPGYLAMAGEISLTQGDPGKAVSLLSQSLAEDPSSIRTLYHLAMAEQKVGKWEAAARHLDEALGIHGMHERALLARAALWLQIGRALDKAALDLQKVLELPQVSIARRASAHQMFGQLSFLEGDRTRAVTEIKAAAELLPKDIEFQLQLAELCLEFYELDEAVARANWVKEVDAGNVTSRMILADALLKRDKPRQSLEALSALEGKKVPAGRFLILRGESLLRVRQFAAAVSDLERVPEIYPEKSEARALSLLARIELDPDAKTLPEQIAKVQAKNPKEPIFYYALGRYRLKKDMGSAAVAAFQKAVALDPRQYLALQALSTIALDKGKVEQAKDYIDKAIAANPYYTESLRLAGLLHLRLGRTADALNSFTRLVTEDPRSAEGFLGIADCLRLMGRSEQALKSVDKAFELGAAGAAAYHLKGRIQQALGHGFLALKALGMADRADPNNPEILADLGFAQLSTRAMTQAEKSFQESLRRKPTSRTQEGLARLFHSKKKYVEAAEGFARAVTLAKKEQLDAEEIYRLNVEAGKTYVQAKGPKTLLSQARHAFRQAALVKPQDAEVLYLMATTFDREDNLNAARFAYQKVLTLAPNHGLTLYHLGLLEYDNRNEAQAKLYLERFLSTGPQGLDVDRARQILAKMH